MGQQVFTWYSASTISNFTGDIAELLHYNTMNGDIPTDAYLGSIQFGQEATHAVDNVTFAANSVVIDLDAKVPRSAGNVGATSSMALVTLSSVVALCWFGLF